jgi:hypothetical protein
MEKNSIRGSKNYRKVLKRDQTHCQKQTSDGKSSQWNYVPRQNDGIIYKYSCITEKASINYKPQTVCLDSKGELWSCEIFFFFRYKYSVCTNETVVTIL